MDILPIIRDLAINTALLLALALLYSAVRETFSASLWLNEQRNLVLGLLFGLAATVTMLFPVTLAPGVIFDVRVIIVALAAVFGGLPVGGVAAVITALARLAIGGAGSWIGSGTVGVALLLGLLFYRQNKHRLEAISPRTFLALGVLLAVEVSLLLFLLPVQNPSLVVEVIWLPLLLIYPFGTMMTGVLLRRDLRRQQRWHVLQERETQYRLLFDNAETFAFVYYNNHYELINRRFEEFIGKTLNELNAPDDDSFSWIAPESRPLVQQRVDTVRQGRIRELPSTYEFDAVNKHGQRVTLEASAAYVARQGAYATYIMMRDITEEKAAAEALRLAEARNRAILEATPDYFVRISAAGLFLEVRGGRPDGQSIVDSKIEDVLSPDLAKQARQAMAQVLTTGQMQSLETESAALGLDDTQGVYEIRFVPINGENEVLAIARDITEQKAIEAALHQAREAEAESRRFAELLRETAAQVSGLLQFDHVMKAVIRNVGQIVSSDATNIMVIEDDQITVTYWEGYQFDLPEPYTTLSVPLDLPNFSEMIRTHQPLCIPDTANYPGWVTYEATSWVRSYLAMPILVRGQVIGFLNLDSATPNHFTDNHTEQIKAFVEQTGLAVALENAQLYDTLQQDRLKLERRVEARTAELSTERARLNTILDTMQEGVIYYKLGNMEDVYVNGAFTRLTGYSQNDILQQGALYFRKSLFPDIARELTRMSENVKGGRIWQHEVRLRRKDDSEFDANLTICPVFSGEDGQITGHVIVIRDISQEQEFRERQIRFIANASHELRTPVTTIRLRTYLLRKQMDQADKHLDVMDKEVDRISDLVEDLMTVSRFERNMIDLHKQPTNLEAVVNEAVQTQLALAEQDQIQLIANLDSACTLQADSARLSQAVNNIIFNAISYTPPNGEVRVDLSADAKAAKLCVCDGGEHIPHEELPHVFTPFYRINKGKMYGTGLGLNIAREIVERHGGTIAAANREGETGNCITITFPLQTSA